MIHRTTSVCFSLLKNVLAGNPDKNNRSTSPSSNVDDFKAKTTTLKLFANTFANHGGILSKIAQILCYSDNDSGHNVFADCKPFNAELTRQFILKKFTEDPEFFDNISFFDPNIYKSGSIGQVHRAIYKDDKEIVVKVQYVGLREQYKTDLLILDQLVKYLIGGKITMKVALDEIKNKLYEELDYTNEAKNQQRFIDLWEGCEWLKIPHIIYELSTENILTTEYINGDSFHNFILTATQEQKNDIGMKLCEFTFKNLYQNNVFYSDLHYGNFLIEDCRILHVLDFGCTHEISDDEANDIKKIHKTIMLNDKAKLMSILEEMNVFNENTTEESKEYAYNYFSLQFEPWISNNFCFSDEWIDKSTKKEMELMKQWNFPRSLVYISKIPFGLYHLTNSLKLEGDFKKMFEDKFGIN